jgi:DNA-binding IclR family transcriptional regulator
MGKVLLAFGPESLLDEVTAEGLRPYTSRTVTSREELERDLERVRRDAWSYAPEQYVAGISAIAVPLRDSEGRVHAAISVAGDSRSIARDRTRLIEAARQTAARIERGRGATFRGRSDELNPLVVSL